jgi:hypothetical protein
MAASGLRSSWLKSARNSSFARFAGLGRFARLSLDVAAHGALDRGGDALGGHLQQIHFVGAEVARLDAADVQHAEQAVVRQQRHAGERADALLPDVGAHVVGLFVERVDDHRLALGGDAAGEAEPDRYRGSRAARARRARARRAREHDLAVLVRLEQNDRGVAVERVAEAREQLADELVEREVGDERGLRDRLDPAHRLADDSASARARSAIASDSSRATSARPADLDLALERRDVVAHLVLAAARA